jgi:hypothetical protein
VADLDRDIEQGTKRLLRCPDEVADLLAQELASLRRQRDRLAGELADLDRQTAPVDLDAEADAAVDALAAGPGARARRARARASRYS